MILFKLLRIFGLIYPRKHTNDNDDKGSIVIEVNNDMEIEANVVKKKYSFFQKPSVRYPFTVFHVIVLSALISWGIIYTVVEAISTKSLNPIKYNFFELIYPMHFFLGMHYYNSEHFRQKKLRLKEYTNQLNIVTIIAITVSLALSITYLVLALLGHTVPIYTHLIHSMSQLYAKICISVLMVVCKFFGHMIFMMNIITFSAVFWIQCKNIITYSEKLESFVKDSCNSLTINDIVTDFSIVKATYEAAVKKLNIMFSFTTVVGIIAAYFLFVNIASYKESDRTTLMITTAGETTLAPATEYNILDITNIDRFGETQVIELLLFVIMEIIYIFIIVKVKNTVSDITEIIESTDFSNRFLSQENLGTYVAVTHIDDYIREIVTPRQSYTTRDTVQSQPLPAASLTPQTASALFQQRDEVTTARRSSQTQPQPSTGTVLLKDQISGRDSLRRQSAINTPVPKRDNNNNTLRQSLSSSKTDDDPDISPPSPSPDDTVKRRKRRPSANMAASATATATATVIATPTATLTKNSGHDDQIELLEKTQDAVLRSLIKCSENGNNLEWLVLINKLNASWENFNILGFELTDQFLIQRLIGIVMGLLMLFNINSTFLT